MSWVKYRGDFRKSRLWRTVINYLNEIKFEVDVYAIDCIRLKSTGKMIGLWSPTKDPDILNEIVTNNLDNYPAWYRYKNNPILRSELKLQVRNKLKELYRIYDKIMLAHRNTMES